MISGTQVNEKIDSLPLSKIIMRVVGDGWRPRKYYMEFVDTKQNTHIRIEYLDDLKLINKILTEFIKKENENRE
jgi:hypothetical protein